MQENFPFFAPSARYDELAKSGAILVSCIGFALLHSFGMSIYTSSLFVNIHFFVACTPSTYNYNLRFVHTIVGLFEIPIKKLVSCWMEL